MRADAHTHELSGRAVAVPGGTTTSQNLSNGLLSEFAASSPGERAGQGRVAPSTAARPAPSLSRDTGRAAEDTRYVCACGFAQGVGGAPLSDCGAHVEKHEECCGVDAHPLFRVECVCLCGWGGRERDASEHLRWMASCGVRGVEHRVSIVPPSCVASCTTLTAQAVRESDEGAKTPPSESTGLLSLVEHLRAESTAAYDRRDFALSSVLLSFVCTINAFRLPPPTRAP